MKNLNAPVVSRRSSTDPAVAQGRCVVIGGAGFIGTNMAHRLAQEGRSVLVFDNFARRGVEQNAAWLKREHPGLVTIQRGDVRDADQVRQAVRGAQVVYHFAAQVAVTTSLQDPRGDFEVNAGGTLNVLEALRQQPSPPPLLYTSTNKVYGDLPQLQLVRRGDRYAPAPDSRYTDGVPEADLDFHSPYGCSKGAADQYVLDYARTFGLPAVVFRMSCIYGPHQCGTADQGWVAHFARAAMRGEPLTIYGDGRQVRDVLFVEDLITAMRQATRQIERTRGQAFNVGGGPGRTISLLELCALLEDLTRRTIDVTFDDWRPSDQRYYVSDTTKLRRTLGWEPSTSVRQGVERLLAWLRESEGEGDGSASEPASTAPASASTKAANGSAATVGGSA